MRASAYRKSVFRLAAAVLAGLSLTACNLTSRGPGSDGNEAPDALDRIRSINLEPRSASNDPSGNSGAGRRPEMTFFGTDAAARTGMIAGEDRAPLAAGEGVELNFESSPVGAVAKVVLGDIMKVGYSVDPRAQGNISLSSGRPIPKARLLYVFEAALRTANLSLVRDGAGGYLITPSTEAIGAGGADMAGGEVQPGYGVTVVPLRHVSAQNVSKLLEGFSVKAGAIRFDAGSNMVVVTGTSAERRAAIDTITSFDADWMRGQSVGVFPIENSTPEPIVAELEKIFDSAEGGRGQGMTKFQAINRMNAILVVTKKPQALSMAGTWIRRLDGSQASAVGVKVYHARYAEAKNLAALLNQVFGGQGGQQGGLDSASSQVAPGGGAATLSPTDRLTGGNAGALLGQSTTQGGMPGAAGGGMGAGLGSLGAGGNSPFGALRPQTAALTGAGDAAASGQKGGAGFAPSALPGVRITADPVNNTVLVYASQDNWRTIERALQQLDRPQRQVAVDLTIAEVTLNDKLNYGVQFFLKSSDVRAGVDKGSIVNATAASAAAGALTQSFPGFNFLMGSQLNPRLVINALHGYTDVKVLSNPSLVVVDNHTATLQVGNQVPVATGSATVLSTSNTVVNTVDYKNTGIILRVVPRINSNGSVMLDVEQEISNVADNGQSQTLTPTLSQRRVKSTIMVNNGQTVLLAGLISDSRSRGRDGIPVLDQIPILGDALSQNKKGDERTELIIFIRPQIIKDGADAALVAEELRSKMRGGKMSSVDPPGAVSPLTPRVIH